MKFKRIIITILMFLMIFSNFLTVFATDDENVETEVNGSTEQSEPINSSSIDGPIDINTSNFNGHVKPATNGYDDGDGIYQGSKFASYYFYNLKEEYFGNNTHGSCGYVAAAMLLSFYDTYMDDRIISEQYEKNGTIAPNLNLTESYNKSPGINSETNALCPSDSGENELKNLNIEDYWTVVQNNWEDYFHLYLIKLAEEQFNMYHDDLVFLEECGITIASDGTCLSTMTQQQELLEYYLYSVKGYTRDEAELVYANTNVRDFAINRIKEGQPVLLLLGGDRGFHFVVAYDLDNKNTEDTSDDDIYAHYGWGDDKVHINIDTDVYPYIVSAMALDFKGEHVCSNNYVDSEENTYCSCYFFCHPEHVHEYEALAGAEAVYHTYKCNCSTVNSTYVSLHNFETVRLDSYEHTQICTDCGYEKSAMAHKFQFSHNNDSYHYAYCSYCDYEISKRHNFECDGTENGLHYEKCVDCGYRLNQFTVGEYTNVTFSGATHICDECGHSETHSHDITFEKIDNTYHRKYCIECGYVKATEEHNYTYSYTPTFANRHKKTCACGASVSEFCVGHASIGGVSYCAYCGQEITKIIDPLSEDEEDALPMAKKEDEDYY